MSMRRGRNVRRRAASIAAVVAVALLVLGATAGEARTAKAPTRSTIALTRVGLTNSKLVATVKLRASKTATRWRLRIDGKQLAAVSLKKRVATTGFLAPGDHTVQAVVQNRRGATLARSTTRTFHVNAIVAAAGDIVCDPTDPGYAGTGAECHFRQTLALLGLKHYHAIFTLGDEQYECGTANAFQVAYASTWGKYKSITHPAVGDHEYGTTKLDCGGGNKASGYFSYFGAAAGDPTKGYYSYDLGGWHVVVLNANCNEIGGCQAGSPEETWLQADLAAHPALCTVAYWHEPRWSSALAGDATQTDAFWRDLYAAKVDLVLNGHAHIYERFAPQNPDGVVVPDGITEIISGVGGRSFAAITNPPHANSVVRENDTYGIVSLSLGKTGYSWQFVPEQGKTFTDSGSAACH
jgi:hypothetical protein